MAPPAETVTIVQTPSAPKSFLSVTLRKGGSKGAEASKKSVSWDELALHNTPDNCWIAVEGVCYDVTQWRATHPGGWRLLEFFAGQDATEPFLAYHPTTSRKLAVARMPEFRVGIMEPKKISIQAEKYREMAKTVEAAGLYKPNPSYYIPLYAYLTALYIATWMLVRSEQILLASCTIGAFWGQLAFVGHDVGHRCVYASKKANDILGLVVTAFLGIGFSHWVDNHNAHHAVVNSSDCDPEVQFMPFIATSTLHFEHTRPNMTPMEKRLSSISQRLVSYQHYSFIPLLFFARYKFYVQSLHSWATAKLYVGRWSELAAQMFFFTWLVALALQLPTWPQVIVWVVMSHASDWVLYLQTVITHFPRDIRPGVQPEWVEAQAIGTLNWTCPAWLDWYHGGLHFQIEHHLFPRIPRHNLRKSSLLLKPFLEDLGIEYHAPTFFGAINESFESLKRVAMEARRG
ncbi:hypothetical protein FOA52_016276 [Chlamydomonas sp. UWO 241]|nr:hypothetical protein FOA52_016276 [Chlamydomonas sp. UWO 241]